MNNQSIVIPGVQIGVPSTTASLRSLADIHTIVVSESLPIPAGYSRYCDETIAVPDPETDLPGYKDALLTLAAREDVKAILPIREFDIYVLAKYRSEFAEFISPVWPEIDVLRAAHDRIKLFDLAADVNIPIPETGLLTDDEFAARERVIKARYAVLTSDYTPEIQESASKDPPKQRYFSADNPPDPAEVTAAMGHVPLMQEYIKGQEFTYRAIYHDGQPQAESIMRKFRCMRYYGGTSVYRDIVDIPEVYELGRRLLDHIGWEGIASVQFIRDERTGEFKLLEINPRLWASVECDIQAGVDWPRYYWDLSTRGSIRETNDNPLSKPTHHLFGELTYLKSVLTDEFPFDDPPSFPRAVWDVGRSLITNPRFDSLRLSDPLPFVVEGIHRTVPPRAWPSPVQPSAGDASRG